MRYVESLLVPVDGELHPFGTAMNGSSSPSRRAIHHSNLLADGTAVVLVEFVGERERVVELADGHEDVISYNISESGESVFAYTHFDPDEFTRQLYEVPMKHEIVVDTPMYYTTDGSLRITTIGELADIRRSTYDMPDGARLELLSTGEYTPGASTLYERLTDRQQETLATAVAVGYYEEPRRVTYEDVAQRLDISAGTVGEHLRKIESKVLTEVLPCDVSVPNRPVRAQRAAGQSR